MRIITMLSIIQMALEYLFLCQEVEYPFVQKISDNNISVHEQSGSSIRCVHEFLVDVSNSESGNPSNSTNTSLKVTDNIPQSPNSAGDSKESVANIASKGARQDEIPEDAARVVVEQAERIIRETPHTIKKILGFAVPILILIFHLQVSVQRLFPTCLLIVHRIIIMVTDTWLNFQGLTALCWMKLLIYGSNHWRLHVIAEMIVIRLTQCQLHQMKALYSMILKRRYLKRVSINTLLRKHVTK